MLCPRYYGEFVTKLPEYPDYGISFIVAVTPKPVLLYGFLPIA